MQQTDKGFCCLQLANIESAIITANSARVRTCHGREYSVQYMVEGVPMFSRMALLEKLRAAGGVIVERNHPNEQKTP